MIIFIANSRKFLKLPENQIWVRAHIHTYTHTHTHTHYVIS
jgi:hypothetical protein